MLRTGKNICFIIIAVSLLLPVSCSKIQPEKPRVPNEQKTWSDKDIRANNTPEQAVGKNSKTCGIITCEAKDRLLKLQLEGKLKLPDLEYYRKRFSLLVKRFPDTNELLESREFKQFVEDVNIDFFSCEGDFHHCESPNKKYGYDEMNYLFYIFIPSMVFGEYRDMPWKSDREVEDILQSIKRKDFVINDIKESLIVQYGKDIREKFKKMDVSHIDVKRLKNDKEYFKQIVLQPETGLYDTFINEALHININWQWEEQMSEIIKTTVEAFYEKLAELWISKEDFKRNVSAEGTVLDLKNKVGLLNAKYDLEKKLPIDRFYRNDELHIFNEKNIRDFEIKTFGNDRSFMKDVLEIKHDTYLLYLLWEDENLFFLPNRLNKLNFENNFIATNIFEYTRNLKFEARY